MKLLVSRRATRRLREIADHIHDRNPTAARFVQRSIRDAFDVLTIYPEAGRLIKPPVRRFVVPRLPYLIYYKLDEAAGSIVIVTVRHSAQRPLLYDLSPKTR